MLALFRLLSFLPLVLLHAAGSALGWLTFGLSSRYRRRLLSNAAGAGLRFAQVRAAVAQAGRLVGEMPRLWFGRAVPLDWDGVELLEAARAQGSGIVFLTPHLGCFEVTAQAYAARFGRITVLYQPARKPWLRTLLKAARARPNLAVAPATLTGVRRMLRALQAGEAVGLLPDQVPPEGLGIWSPFFGRPAYTMTLAARLARQGGTRVLLAWGERLAWGRGYRIHLRELAAPLPQEPRAAVAQLNREMERLILECPQQYLWGYARYKQPRRPA